MSDQTEPNATKLSPHEITSSDKKGFMGVFEKTLRQFKILTQVLLALPLYVLASALIGLCLIPGLLIIRGALFLSNDFNFFLKLFLLGTSLAGSFFLSGFTAMILFPLANRIFVGSLKEWKGPYFSTESVRWYIQNGLLYLIRYSFLEFVTPSPFGLWFYSAMGMKIGKGTIINSTNISDPSLVSLGKRVTIGGSATIVAHYGQGGFLILAPVRIEDDVTIGLRAIIMGGSTIGRGAKVLPNSVVMPKTIIPDGEVWGGVPAVKVNLRALAKKDGLGS